MSPSFILANLFDDFIIDSVIFTLIISVNFKAKTLSLLFSLNEFIFVFTIFLINYLFTSNLFNIIVLLFIAPQHY